MIKSIIISYLAVISLLLVALGCSNEPPEIKLSGDYLGQRPPDSRPEMFAPGIVSDGYGNRDMAISPDGNTIFYTIFLSKRTGVIMSVRREQTTWSKPAVAQFSGLYSDLEPAFSHDGRRLYFASNRPLKDGDPPKDYDIWYVEVGDAGWGEPVNLGEPINSGQNEFYPSLTETGVLYFTAPSEDGGEDIFRSEPLGDRFDNPKKLSDSVNSPRGEFNALVAPDESFLIFSSYGREDDMGGSDMYISFRNEDGSWTQAVNLKAPLNSNRIDYCPALSPDGRYFFFASSRLSDEFEQIQLKTYDDIQRFQDSPGNGNDDIYWVDAGVLERFKPKK